MYIGKKHVVKEDKVVDAPTKTVDNVYGLIVFSEGSEGETLA